MIEKGGYPHFMLKEIHEQPQALRNAMRGRVDISGNSIRLGGLIGRERYCVKPSASSLLPAALPGMQGWLVNIYWKNLLVYRLK